jgi:protein TonB
MEANQTTPAYELKDELTRYCLAASGRDPNRKLAWVNSICILFLIIGIFGAKAGKISITPAPPVEEIIPTIIEPMTPPAPATEEQNQEQTDQETTESPQVVVVTPNAPNINFGVPTIGNVIVLGAIVKAPPLNPLQPPGALNKLPSNLNVTGSGGERPQPAYPKIALEQGEQGSVTVLMSADETGNITSVEVQTSSGFPLLDRATVDFIKRHWTTPSGMSNHLFQATITYKLETN